MALSRSLEIATIELALLAIVAALAWPRMVRYRELADRKVFRVYPAEACENKSDPKVLRH